MLISLSYEHRNKFKLQFYRTTSQFEVDFIIEDKVAIEIKAINNLRSENFRGLRALQEENKMKELIIVSLDKNERISDGIHCYHWESFLRDLWRNKIIK